MRAALVFAVLLFSTAAMADAGADDVEALVKQLDVEHAALSTNDCVVACRAVASIRRAAEKICALERGPRCEAARSKAADATRRVREACPDCSIPGAAAGEDRGTSPERAAEPAARPLSTPRSEEAAPPGGCRSCEATGHDPSGLFGTLGIVIGVALALRRKRHCATKV